MFVQQEREPRRRGDSHTAATRDRCAVRGPLRRYVENRCCSQQAKDERLQQRADDECKSDSASERKAQHGVIPDEIQ
ncbi:hypothetical protein Misp05_22740 [Micromonospora sp. NBRC 107095]|nr:hypothetical protein Misp05_22740 [Micromonospora sp. NBRC 107095]